LERSREEKLERERERERRRERDMEGSNNGIALHVKLINGKCYGKW